jgi:hypothetical protein
MDDFFGWVFCTLMALCLAICVGCSIGGKKDELSGNSGYLETVIKAAKKAGCKKYSIVVDKYLETTKFTCLESE